jgi:hypothetical protein
MLSKVHAVPGPSIEVVLHVHATSDALGGAYGPEQSLVTILHHKFPVGKLDKEVYVPVLLERARSINRRLVRARRSGNIVSTAVALEAAFALRPAAGIVRAVGFDDVVLDERVTSPAVDGEVAVTLRLEVAAVVDGTVVVLERLG